MSLKKSRSKKKFPSILSDTLDTMKSKKIIMSIIKNTPKIRKKYQQSPSLRPSSLQKCSFLESNLTEPQMREIIELVGLQSHLKKNTTFSEMCSLIEIHRPDLMISLDDIYGIFKYSSFKKHGSPFWHIIWYYLSTRIIRDFVKAGSNATKIINTSFLAYYIADYVLTIVFNYYKDSSDFMKEHKIDEKLINLIKNKLKDFHEQNKNLHVAENKKMIQEIKKSAKKSLKHLKKKI